MALETGSSKPSNRTIQIAGLFEQHGPRIIGVGAAVSGQCIRRTNAFRHYWAPDIHHQRALLKAKFTEISEGSLLLLAYRRENFFLASKS